MKLTPLWISSKVTHNSCTKSTLCSAHKDSPVAETFSTLIAFTFPLCCGTKSLHHRLRLRKRFVGWNWLLCGPAFSHPSLVQSPPSVQHIKTVQWPKHSTHSLQFLFLFSMGPSLYITDLRLRKRFFGWQFDFFKGQLLVTHLLYKVHPLFSALRWSSAQNI